tara:strand:- start:598 stop:789 length:192 start_codon:yes stop_codon:yes gene_type:complete
MVSWRAGTQTPARFLPRINMFGTLKSKITEATVAAMNGLTGLGFLGAITLVILVKEFRDRNEK